MKSIFVASLFLLFTGQLWSQMAITSEDFDRQQMANNRSVSVQNSYEVIDISVNASIQDQMAEVSVTQTIYNPGNTSLEVEMFFPLPNGGIVQNFMLMVNGKEMPGKLLPATEARSIYEGIVRRKKDPAIMEYAGYGLFKTSVFPIPVGEERKITVRYTQILDKLNDVINFSYPFGTQKFSGKALKQVSFYAKIKTTDELKNVFSPSDEIKIDRNSKKEAVVKFEKTYYLPSQDFKMSFSVENTNMGTSLLSYWPKNEKSGYFMLMSSPGLEEAKEKIINKNIVFVLDHSGSMAGKKIEQAKKALEFVLKNLNEGDRFNIVKYDDRIETFKSEMQVFSKSTLQDALTYVSDIHSDGGTNIHDAIVSGLSFLTDNEHPNYLMFITDGLPTAGTTGENEIASAAVTNNKQKARIFAFGVGDDVNARLLDRLSTSSNGLSVYVKPMEDIEVAIAKLYSSISSPVLTDVKISIDGTDITQTYPEKLPDVFKGGQLVWVGKYTKSGKVKVKMTGKFDGKEKTFEFERELFKQEEGNAFDYVEKIWASRRVAHLINLIDLNGKNQELVNDLVEISKKYGILTPYTAFIALEDTELDTDKLRSSTSNNLNELQNTSGASATAQRDYKMKNMNNEMVKDEVVSVDMYGNEKKVETVKKVANKTFYYKNKTWLDESVTDDKSTAEVTIKKFSKEYFELSNENSNEISQYLSIQGDVKFIFNNKVYNIVE